MHWSLSSFPIYGSTTRRALQQWQKRGLKSLAISVFYKHPRMLMEKYEVLMRGTAFLLGVTSTADSSGLSNNLYNHLLEETSTGSTEKEKTDRIDLESLSVACGLKRPIKDLGWLEFLPKEKTPSVHLITCRHVLAPWLYHPQSFEDEILKYIRGRHCLYFVEVFDIDKPGEPALARFDLGRDPILHSSSDIAMIHLKDEAAALSRMKELGVETLRLRESKYKIPIREELLIEGYELGDPRDLKNVLVEESDFVVSVREKGSVAEYFDDRFLVKTPRVLTRGACGSPAVDKYGRVAGVVEGVVSPNQRIENHKRIIDNAVVIPDYHIAEFVESSERQMLEQIVPKQMFDRIVEIKTGNVQQQVTQ